jgi:hypothetical protein
MFGKVSQFAECDARCYAFKTVLALKVASALNLECASFCQREDCVLVTPRSFNAVINRLLAAVGLIPFPPALPACCRSPFIFISASARRPDLRPCDRSGKIQSLDVCEAGQKHSVARIRSRLLADAVTFRTETQ